MLNPSTRPYLAPLLAALREIAKAKCLAMDHVPDPQLQAHVRAVLAQALQPWENVAAGYATRQYADQDPTLRAILADLVRMDRAAITLTSVLRDLQQPLPTTPPNLALAKVRRTP